MVTRFSDCLKNLSRKVSKSVETVGSALYILYASISWIFFSVLLLFRGSSCGSVCMMFRSAVARWCVVLFHTTKQHIHNTEQKLQCYQSFIVTTQCTKNTGSSGKIPRTEATFSYEKLHVKIWVTTMFKKHFMRGVFSLQTKEFFFVNFFL